MNERDDELAVVRQRLDTVVNQGVQAELVEALQIAIQEMDAEGIGNRTWSAIQKSPALRVIFEAEGDGLVEDEGVGLEES